MLQRHGSAKAGCARLLRLRRGRTECLLMLCRMRVHLHGCRLHLLLLLWQRLLRGLLLRLLSQSLRL